MIALYTIFVLAAFCVNLQCSSGGSLGNQGSIVHMSADDTTSKQSWAYVTVRPKAHMFYWLYHTTNSRGYENTPLIMWLQGGPGGSGTGFGNFMELGPLDVNLKPRKTTWLQVASLLFVDNPVGTGYSYVDDDSAYTHNVQEISVDLLTMMKNFVQKHKEFQKIPFYIFSESYGGKMTAAFSDVLYEAIRKGELAMNFKGFAMGDSWISPIDSVLSWGPYLHATSLVSHGGLEEINKGAKACEKLVDEGHFSQATQSWSILEDIVGEETSNVDFYNIMKFDTDSKDWSQKSALEKLYQRHVKKMANDDLGDLMNGPIRKKLKIIPDNVTWGGQSQQVFSAQGGDFMKNVTSTVNKLINENKLKVIVYSGQLDLICDVLGTEAWFARLDIAKDFYKVDKQQYSCGEQNPVCYFGSHYKNVSFYWILKAGHMVPADNGPGALSMVSQIIGKH